MKTTWNEMKEWCKKVFVFKTDGTSSDEPIGQDKDASVETKKKDKEQDLRSKLERYLWKRYDFRFNVLTEQAEYRLKDGEAHKYKVATVRAMNTLCLEAQEHGVNCWDKDVSRLLNSERLADYHPFLTYMDTLPRWDGVDRVTPLARRVTGKEFWVKGFHCWMLGVAAQWSGQTGRCANTVAPMLISREQGMNKSSFCKMLMPESLSDYYTDSFDLTGQAGCEQKLSLFGLINLDEYDKLPVGKLPLLKNLMQMTSLHYRKAHRASYSHLPRMASFIGTSNKKDLLADPSGSRRYLCVELKQKLDCTPLEHGQLFAQLKAELAQGERYWFTTEEEKELMLHNEEFYIVPPSHDVFFRCFRLPEEGEEFKLYAASTLFVILSGRFPVAMRGMNVNSFGKLLTALGVERVHTMRGNMYKVVPVDGESKRKKLPSSLNHI
jgi:predicted P-loop ATPase